MLFFLLSFTLQGFTHTHPLYFPLHRLSLSLSLSLFFPSSLFSLSSLLSLSFLALSLFSHSSLSLSLLALSSITRSLFSVFSLSLFAHSLFSHSISSLSLLTLSPRYYSLFLLALSMTRDFSNCSPRHFTDVRVSPTYPNQKPVIVPRAKNGALSQPNWDKQTELLAQGRLHNLRTCQSFPA